MYTFKDNIVSEAIQKEKVNDVRRNVVASMLRMGYTVPDQMPATGIAKGVP